MAMAGARRRIPKALRRAAGPIRTRLIKEPWRSAYTNSIVTHINLHFLDGLVARVGRLEVPGGIVEP